MTTTIDYQTAAMQQLGSNNVRTNRYSKYYTSVSSTSGTASNELIGFSDSNSKDGKLGDNIVENVLEDAFYIAKGAVKGLGSMIKGMFCGSDGKFSIGQTLKTAAMTALCFIPFVGPAIGIGFGVVGAVNGVKQVASGLSAAASATTDAEKKEALESIGSGALTTGLSVLAAKGGATALKGQVNAVSNAVAGGTTDAAAAAGCQNTANAVAKIAENGLKGNLKTSAVELGKAMLKDGKTNAINAAKVVQKKGKNALDKAKDPKKAFQEHKYQKAANKYSEAQRQIKANESELTKLESQKATATEAELTQIEAKIEKLNTSNEALAKIEKPTLSDTTKSGKSKYEKVSSESAKTMDTKATQKANAKQASLDEAKAKQEQAKVNKQAKELEQLDKNAQNASDEVLKAQEQLRKGEITQEQFDQIRQEALDAGKAYNEKYQSSDTTDAARTQIDTIKERNNASQKTKEARQSTSEAQTNLDKAQAKLDETQAKYPSKKSKATKRARREVTNAKTELTNAQKAQTQAEFNESFQNAKFEASRKANMQFKEVSGNEYTVTDTSVNGVEKTTTYKYNPETGKTETVTRTTRTTEMTGLDGRTGEASTSKTSTTVDGKTTDVVEVAGKEYKTEVVDGKTKYYENNSEISGTKYRTATASSSKIMKLLDRLSNFDPFGFLEKHNISDNALYYGTYTLNSEDDEMLEALRKAS